jgi:hypothetical protein
LILLKIFEIHGIGRATISKRFKLATICSQSENHFHAL